MADIQDACSMCKKDRGTNFCTECGRTTRCPDCETFVEADFKFCPDCRHHMRKSPKTTPRVDKSVSVEGAVGHVATGDHYEGDMTAYVYTQNLQKETNSINWKERDVLTKSAVDKSVHVRGSVGLLSTGDHHEGAMTAYIGPANTQDTYSSSYCMKAREHLGFPRKQTSKSEMRKSNDDSSDIEFHDLVSDLAKKVGCIWSPVCTGTAFRVGEDLIITCWHVIRDIIGDMRNKHGVKDIYKCRDVWVQFDYKPGEEHYNSGHRFLFTCLMDYNVELDYAIVRLDDPAGSLPLPIRRFSRAGVHDTLHLIGHSRSWHKRLDPDCLVDSPTLEAVAKCEHQLKTYLGSEWSAYQWDCYQGLEKDHRIRFHSGFVNGASGSPGAVRVFDGLSVVTMFDRGYPGFYYSLSEAKQKELDLPNGFFLEEGIDMMAILDDVKEKRPDIYHLFGVN